MATPAQRMDLASIARFDFETPDLHRFPALRLAREALEEGGAAPIVLNAANEVGVASFLAGRIGFADIAAIVERALDHGDFSAPASIAEVLEVDRMTRAQVESAMQAVCQ
jgi:1-deoxy-D-xylulose-5-phosphate reductoisomerase